MAKPWKWLERRWKALCFRLVFLALPGRSERVPLPNGGACARKVLFIRPDGIGDAIVSTRLLQTLAGRYPHWQLHLLGSPRNAPLLARLSCIEKVHLFDKRRRGALLRLAVQLRRERYHVVVDCRVIEPSLTALLLMLASGARHRLGIAERGIDRALTAPIPRTRGHIIEQLAEFAAPFGLDRSELLDRPLLETTTAERLAAEDAWSTLSNGSAPVRFLVNVSAGEATRCWPEERFIKVIRSVRERTGRALTIAIVGAPAEVQRITAIARAAGVPALPTPSLGALIALVEASDLVLTPDTSVVHIAAAFRKPTFALYLPGTARQWGAYKVEGANLESAGATLEDLSADEVLGALGPVLERIGASSPMTR